MADETQHTDQDTDTPVTRKDTVDILEIKKDGIYVDGKLLISLSKSDKTPNVIVIKNVKTIIQHTTSSSINQTFSNGMMFRAGGVTISGLTNLNNMSHNISPGAPTEMEIPTVSLHVYNTVDGPISLGSGKITITGDALEGVTTSSGNVTIVGSVLSGSVKTMSGSVDVSGSIMGDTKTMSGNIFCDGDIVGRASTMSGNVKITGTKRERYKLDESKSLPDNKRQKRS